jgi:hypothetical protein
VHGVTKSLVLDNIFDGIDETARVYGQYSNDKEQRVNLLQTHFVVNFVTVLQSCLALKKCYRVRMCCSELLQFESVFCSTTSTTFCNKCFQQYKTFHNTRRKKFGYNTQNEQTT